MTQTSHYPLTPGYDKDKDKYTHKDKHKHKDNDKGTRSCKQNVFTYIGLHVLGLIAPTVHLKTNTKTKTNTVKKTNTKTIAKQCRQRPNLCHIVKK